MTGKEINQELSKMHKAADETIDAWLAKQLAPGEPYIPTCEHGVSLLAALCAECQI